MKKETKNIRIDAVVWYRLKMRATKEKRSLKDLITELSKAIK